MTDLDLNELERLEKGADILRNGRLSAGTAGNADLVAFDGNDVTGIARFDNPARAAYVAALCNALPELLRRLRAAEADAERWQRLCELWAASIDLRLRQDEEGTWSITQLEDAEGEVFQRLVGDTPDAAIDAARRP